MDDVQVSGKPAQARALSGSRGERRRARILTALHDCIIAQGYAKTTLRDVAKAAGMSASHLLYYFSGKDAILETYFQTISDILLARIEGFRQYPPEQQVGLLADLFFAGKGLTRSEIGFMLECFGVAVHDPQLRQLKADLDRQCKAYLRDLFESLDGDGHRSSEDASEIAYAILIGLRTATYFDPEIELPQTRRLFADSIRRLAGLPN